MQGAQKLRSEVPEGLRPLRDRMQRNPAPSGQMDFLRNHQFFYLAYVGREEFFSHSNSLKNERMIEPVILMEPGDCEPSRREPVFRQDSGE